MSKTKPETRQRLFETADSQGGFFTSKQATIAGYSPKNFGFHVKTGNWVHEGHGMYRLRDYPEQQRSDLIKVWLWSRNREDIPQAVFSHETALSLYELSDYIPKHIHITVPIGFRKSSTPGLNLKIHRARKKSISATRVGLIPVTSPLQTLLDVNQGGRFSNTEMTNMIHAAITQGIVNVTEIKKEKKLANF